MVKISGFGTFCVKENKGLKGRNRQTSEDMMLGARRIVNFRCSPVIVKKLIGKE
jgi:integration host factor subunit alpha